jgi:hypothetical protein
VELLNIERYKLAGRMLSLVLLPHSFEVIPEVGLWLPCALVELETSPLHQVICLAIGEPVLGQDVFHHEFLVGVMA